MNLVTLTRLTIEDEGDLTGCLFRGDSGVYGQQSKTRQCGYATLQAIGVADRLPQHLIATADAHDKSALAMSAHDGLRTTIAPQFEQIVERGFRSWQNDNVRPLNIGGVVGIEQVHARVTLQRVEICEITDVAQENHRHIHLTLRPLALLLLKADAVLFLNVDVFIVGNYA